jgi:dTMP kinase
MLAEHLTQQGYAVLVTREPGGTDIGEQIRSVILRPENTAMAPVTEVLLYAACRAQIVQELIRPALEAGQIVLCDRFLDSSVVYQGYGRGLLDAVNGINAFATDGLAPDLTILLKIGAQAGLARIREKTRDRIESESAAWHEQVYAGYLALEQANPERIRGIDANGSVSEVHDAVLRVVSPLLDASASGAGEAL